MPALDPPIRQYQQRHGRSAPEQGFGPERALAPGSRLPAAPGRAYRHRHAEAEQHEQREQALQPLDDGPAIMAKIEVDRLGDVRRAKLYYLRDRIGKKAKIKEKRTVR